jgi:hypothetical protein
VLIFAGWAQIQQSFRTAWTGHAKNQMRLGSSASGGCGVGNQEAVMREDPLESLNLGINQAG